MRSVSRGLLTIAALILGMSCATSSSAAGISVRTGMTPIKYYRSIGLVSTQPTDKAKGMRMTGTAFAVDNDHLLTAGHVCRGAQKAQKDGMAKRGGLNITLVNRHGHHSAQFRVGILAISETRDICLLYKRDHGMDPLALSRRVDDVEVEDQIVVVGAPRGYFMVRREGWIISNSVHFSNLQPDLLFLACPVEKGNSGSPVIWNGEVIGMVVLKPGNLPDSGLAEKSDIIRKFVEQNRFKAR